MKISKKYLQKIIREEFNKVLLNEDPFYGAGPTVDRAELDPQMECEDLEWPQSGQETADRLEWWNEVPQQGSPDYNQGIKDMAKSIAFANDLEVLKKFYRLYPNCYELEYGGPWHMIASAEEERFDDIMKSAIKNWNSWHSSAGATAPANENRITVKSLARLIEQQLDRIL